MAYIEINSAAIRSNLKKVQDACGKQSIDLRVVTKFCLSDSRVLAFLAGAGVTSIADANMANFAGFMGNLSRAVIKTKLSDILAIPELPPHARPDRLFVSDDVLLKAIAGLPKEMRPRAVLITELGDLRDGFYPEDIPAAAARYPQISFAGVSANFACLSGKMPSLEAIHTLYCCAEKICRQGERPQVSIGGTVSFPFIVSGESAGMVTELRMGEGVRQFRRKFRNLIEEIYPQ